MDDDYDDRTLVGKTFKETFDDKHFPKKGKYSTE